MAAMRIARVGVSVELARSAARGVDVGEVERALREAIDQRIDLIDAGADAERLVGDVVRAARVRDDAIVACSIAPTPRVPDPRHVQACVETSLRATRLDALPLCQLAVRAAWRTSSAWVELRGTCERLVREGKVLRWGAIVDELVELDDWLATASVAYNACEREAEPTIAAATARGRVVLARRPLAGGALAGELGPGVKLARTDDRRAIDLERVAAGIARLAAFVRDVPVAARSCDPAREALERALRERREPLECATVAELALRFAIAGGAIPLVRLHRREHVARVVAAGDAPPLSAELVRRVREQIPPRDS
jgi:aryl-alcohol dehydrogenase-like predicted oxidoreductase